MFALGVCAALLAAAAWALGSVLFARALSARDAVNPAGSGGSAAERTAILTPAAATTFKNTLALGAFVALLPLFGGAWPEARAGWLLVVSGLLGFAIGDALYFGALQRCGTQTAATIVLLNVPLAATLDRVVYGAALTLLQLFGMGVTLLGVLLVVTDPGAQSGAGPRDPHDRRIGVLLSFGVVAVIAAAIVLGHGESQSSGVIQIAVLRALGGVLGAIPIAFALGVPRRRVGVEFARLAAPFRAKSVRSTALWAACALAVVGLVPYHFALRELNSALGAILFATTPLFTLVLARFSGERYGRRGLIGTLVGFGGVALIVFAHGEKAS